MNAIHHIPRRDGVSAFSPQQGFPTWVIANAVHEVLNSYDLEIPFSKLSQKWVMFLTPSDGSYFVEKQPLSYDEYIQLNEHRLLRSEDGQYDTEYRKTEFQNYLDDAQEEDEEHYGPYQLTVDWKKVEKIDFKKSGVVYACVYLEWNPYPTFAKIQASVNHKWEVLKIRWEALKDTHGNVQFALDAQDFPASFQKYLSILKSIQMQWKKFTFVETKNKISTPERVEAISDDGKKYVVSIVWKAFFNFKYPEFTSATIIETPADDGISTVEAVDRGERSIITTSISMSELPSRAIYVFEETGMMQRWKNPVENLTITSPTGNKKIVRFSRLEFIQKSVIYYKVWVDWDTFPHLAHLKIRNNKDVFFDFVPDSFDFPSYGIDEDAFSPQDMALFIGSNGMFMWGKKVIPEGVAIDTLKNISVDVVIDGTTKRLKVEFKHFGWMVVPFVNSDGKEEKTMTLEEVETQSQIDEMKKAIDIFSKLGKEKDELSLKSEIAQIFVNNIYTLLGKYYRFHKVEEVISFIDEQFALIRDIYLYLNDAEWLQVDGLFQSYSSWKIHVSNKANIATRYEWRGEFPID